MARPPLAIGTHGSITTNEVNGQWQAYARFRDTDGVTRQVERWGPTETKAKKALRDAFRERSGKSGAQLKNTSKVADLAKVWIGQIEKKVAEGVRSGTTYDTYSVYLRNVVVPEIGNLRLDECTVGRLEDLMDTLQAEDMSADARRSVRTVLSGIFGLAVRRD